MAYAGGISNYKELLAFAQAANKGADLSPWQNEKGEVCLTADIDMKKGKKYPSVLMFRGVFDGCGYKFYNWDSRTPLFKEIDASGVVKNVVIDASCQLIAKVGLNTEDIKLAYIAHLNRGKILNCQNYGSVDCSGFEVTKNVFVGTIVAQNANIVHNCKNAGNVSVRVDQTVQKKGMYLRIGGLIGANAAKPATSSVVSRCENTGNVTYMGDYPISHAGGILGESGMVPVKYCVNRGGVAAIGMPFSVKEFKGFVRVAGITVWANKDVICCDNYGVVAVSGAHESFSAGICARPNGAMNLMNCINYGKVSTNASMPTYAGGIAAQTIMNVHIADCYNFGEIVAEGPNRANSIGGIVGYLMSRKDLKQGAFVRNCINYANITNNSKSKYCSTAGIVGAAAGLDKKDAPDVIITVAGCENFGKISAVATDRTGGIIGYYRQTVDKKGFYNDLARAAKPLSNGATLFGRVTDTDGMPVVGAVISDGLQSVKTNSNGEYFMKSDMSKVRFVQISVPSAYEMPERENRPQMFRRVLRGWAAARADFNLKKRTEASDNFVLAMIGDPQVRAFGGDKSIERFRDVFIPDLATLKSSYGKDVYAITLGDLLYNYMTIYDDYVDVVAKADLPMFSVIGNHDQEQGTIFGSEYGTPYFESYLAPQNYSFNIGKMHFVVLNSTIFDRTINTEKVQYGLSSSTYEWLENDLKYVPRESTVVVCSHAPLFKEHSGYNDDLKHYNRYSELFSQFNKVYAWAGHRHENYHFDYANATEAYSALKGVESILVGRCIGALRHNREMSQDGTPNGYMVAEVEGDKMSWYYKSVGQDRSRQMRVYSPTESASTYVKANIWNYSHGCWSTPEWWENGVKVADMELSNGESDYDYLKIYAEHNKQKMDARARHHSRPTEVRAMFKVVPTAGVTSGEVRVTDQFGVTYIEKVQW